MKHENLTSGANQPEPAKSAPESGMVIDGLAKLPERAILDEKALAAELAVTPRTIRRMVQRFELPPPVRFGGRSVWLTGRVLEHLEHAADKAAKEAEKNKLRISRLHP